MSRVKHILTVAAFILFRQHHQAAVVAKNPGLANPEISKIIGDSWRTASADTKTHWKRLAEVCPIVPLNVQHNESFL